MRALLVLACVVAAVAAASGIATLPYTENDACLPGSETEPYPDVATQWVPFGLRCVYADGEVEVLAPGVGAWLAWILVVAVALLTAARLRRYAAARGVVAATLALGLCGLPAHQVELMGALLGTVFLGPLLVLAVDLLLRRPRTQWLAAIAFACVAPVGAVTAWFFGSGLSGANELGFLAALLTGAALALMCDRWIPAYRPAPA